MRDLIEEKKTLETEWFLSPPFESVEELYERLRFGIPESNMALRKLFQISLESDWGLKHFESWLAAW